MSVARIDRVVTSGTFSLDGGTWEVENNVWLYGDDEVVAVIDAAHDAQAIMAAVGGRRVAFIVLTHGHDDHIDAAAELADLTGAPLLLHPDDRMLWTSSTPRGVPTSTSVTTTSSTSTAILLCGCCCRRLRHALILNAFGTS